MMQPPRDGKTMTSKHRKPPNQRCCFLFRIEGMKAVGACAYVLAHRPAIDSTVIWEATFSKLGRVCFGLNSAAILTAPF